MVDICPIVGVVVVTEGYGYPTYRGQAVLW